MQQVVCEANRYTVILKSNPHTVPTNKVKNCSAHAHTERERERDVYKLECIHMYISQGLYSCIYASLRSYKIGASACAYIRMYLASRVVGGGVGVLPCTRASDGNHQTQTNAHHPQCHVPLEPIYIYVDGWIDR